MHVGKATDHHAVYHEVDSVTPEVNLRECTSHRPMQSVNKASHSGFECHQMSKAGFSVALKTDMCPV